MNGVINFSILDGWWLEGYRDGAGWAITEHRTYQDQGQQDKLDASTIYSMLEHEIIPFVLFGFVRRIFERLGSCHKRIL